MCIICFSSHNYYVYDYDNQQTEKAADCVFKILPASHFIISLMFYAISFQSHDAYGPFCPSHFCDVFDRCLLLNPDERPSFSEIRQSLVAEVSLCCL